MHLGFNVNKLADWVVTYTSCALVRVLPRQHSGMTDRTDRRLYSAYLNETGVQSESMPGY